MPAESKWVYFHAPLKDVPVEKTSSDEQVYSDFADPKRTIKLNGQEIFFTRNRDNGELSDEFKQDVNNFITSIIPNNWTSSNSEEFKKKLNQNGYLGIIPNALSYLLGSQHLSLINPACKITMNFTKINDSISITQTIEITEVKTIPGTTLNASDEPGDINDINITMQGTFDILPNNDGSTYISNVKDVKISYGDSHNNSIVKNIIDKRDFVTYIIEFIYNVFGINVASKLGRNLEPGLDLKLSTQTAESTNVENTDDNLPGLRR